ncbi:hypothetical protein PCE1_003607 [Barthelona sp. PCE]
MQDILSSSNVEDLYVQMRALFQTVDSFLRGISVDMDREIMYDDDFSKQRDKIAELVRYLGELAFSNHWKIDELMDEVLKCFDPVLLDENVHPLVFAFFTVFFKLLLDHNAINPLLAHEFLCKIRTGNLDPVTSSSSAVVPSQRRPVFAVQCDELYITLGDGFCYSLYDALREADFNEATGLTPTQIERLKKRNEKLSIFIGESGIIGLIRNLRFKEALEIEIKRDLAEGLVNLVKHHIDTAQRNYHNDKISKLQANMLIKANIPVLIGTGADFLNLFHHTRQTEKYSKLKADIHKIVQDHGGMELANYLSIISQIEAPDNAPIIQE